MYICTYLSTDIIKLYKLLMFIIGFIIIFTWMYCKLVRTTRGSAVQSDLLIYVKINRPIDRGIIFNILN